MTSVAEALADGRIDLKAQASTPTHQRRLAALQAAIARGALSDDARAPSALLLMDLDAIHVRIAELRAAFPRSALHTVAVKANPVGRVLELFRDAGFGAEAASLGELAQALRVGFEPSKVVFDSPAKTRAELVYALEAGVRMNFDNFEDLARAAEVLAVRPELVPPRGRLGVRINPQVGSGSIAALSTGGAVSKFGMPLTEVRADVVAAFVRHPWLSALHLHTGSQGVPLGRVADGVAAVWTLAREVDAACGGGGSSGGGTHHQARVAVLDIGGGMPVDFVSDEAPAVPACAELASLLRARIPELFLEEEGTTKVQLVTENGRSLLAKAGCVASRVEFVKSSGGRRIAVAHVGADLLPRTAYLPDTWALRIFCADAAGRGRECGDGAEWEVQDVAGPLCFEGDRLATARRLPRLRAGDHVVVTDVGAYALSMYSHYNSRQAPGVWGYCCTGGGGADGGADGGGAGGGGGAGDGGAGGGGAGGGGGAPWPQLRQLRAPDTLESVLEFWNKVDD